MKAPMGKKAFAIAAVALLSACFASPAAASDSAEKWVGGGFEMAGYLSVGAGWQRFSNAPITEQANDGSYAGVMGSVIQAVPPSPGQDDAQAFVEMGEIDITKNFDDRARLRGDIWIGRPNSGSWVPFGIEVEQAYAAVTLSQKHRAELMLGRFEVEAGFEDVLPYNNDTISWSIISRANLYPYYATGAQISWGVADGIDLYVGASNSIINDWNLKTNEMPSFFATLSVKGNDGPSENWFTITPFFGPESNSNRHFTYGVDVAAAIWPMPPLQIGFEGVFHRDDGYGGPGTNYAAGLLNLHYDFTERWWGFARYTYAQQFEAGNGFLNLTGAKQQIHEMSLGGGYLVAEGMKLKIEARTDAVLPDGGAAQWVPGIAMGIACAF